MSSAGCVEMRAEESGRRMASMITAWLVRGSATTYCQMRVVASNRGCTIGCGGSLLGFAMASVAQRTWNFWMSERLGATTLEDFDNVTKSVLRSRACRFERFDITRKGRPSSYESFFGLLNPADVIGVSPTIKFESPSLLASRSNRGHDLFIPVSDF